MRCRLRHGSWCAVIGGLSRFQTEMQWVWYFRHVGGIAISDSVKRLGVMLSLLSRNAGQKHAPGFSVRLLNGRHTQRDPLLISTAISFILNSTPSVDL